DYYCDSWDSSGAQF
nr:immunoglobulin light chain junction region [Macaca mulatta]MOV67370.1 immunoglobulin light chain junction region [Macaca mulatta]MOV71081.1 immunoglobulin light chain junction region [Macaca mulatta]MOV71643.1 immunoglobulin light chain junction region [Macaca mulatta]